MDQNQLYMVLKIHMIVIIVTVGRYQQHQEVTAQEIAPEERSQTRILIETLQVSEIFTGQHLT